MDRADSVPGITVFNQAPAVDGLDTASDGKGLSVYNAASPFLWDGTLQPVFALSVRNTGMSLTLTSPAASDSWEQASAHDIAWTWGGDPGSLRVVLLKAGQMVSALAAQTANTGVFHWTVPADLTPADDYKVQIASISEPACLSTSPQFSIVKSSSGLEVVWPNTATTIPRGKKVRICWTTWGAPGDTVKIDLYRGRSVWLRDIAPSTANNGEYEWTVPTDLEIRPDYCVRISSISLPQYYDFGDENFSIKTQNAAETFWKEYR